MKTLIRPMIGSALIMLASCHFSAAVAQTLDPALDPLLEPALDPENKMVLASSSRRSSGLWEKFQRDWTNGAITGVSDITQTYQGITSGGLQRRDRYGAHVESVLNFDMGKLAGMNGLSIKVRGEAQLGDFINQDTGALLATNSTGLFPTPGVRDAAVTNFQLTQMFNRRFGVFAGKVDTLDTDSNMYAHGRGKDQFMNTSFINNPIAFRTTPYSTWGAGFMIMGDEPDPMFVFYAIDPRDFATTFNLDEVYSEGVTLSAELRLPVEVRGQPGHLLMGGIWSEHDVALLDFAPLLTLPSGPPSPTETESWALYWNFDQQLFAHPCRPDKGWGIFGRAAIADEDTNPIASFLSFGVGGDSIIPGRSEDRFGIGWFYSRTSDQIPTTVLQRSGQGVEFFYNWAVSDCLRITPDLQVIDSARPGVKTAIVAGIRFSLTL